MPFSEDIAKKIAGRKARLYWPHGEPHGEPHGSRGREDHERERRRGVRAKERWQGVRAERQAEADLKRKGKAEGNAEAEELKSFEPISEVVKKERRRRLEHALKSMAEKRVVPKDVSFKKWLSEPGNLDRAQKRGMVRMIASRANPKSKDTEDVATVGGKRYAKTDLYEAPIRERVKEATTRTKYGAALWWDSNKRVVVVAAVSLVAGWMFYSVWKNAQLEKDLARQHVHRHHLLAHATGWFADPRLAGGREPYSWEFEEFAGRPSGYSWW